MCSLGPEAARSLEDEMLAAFLGHEPPPPENHHATRVGGEALSLTEEADQDPLLLPDVDDDPIWDDPDTIISIPPGEKEMLVPNKDADAPPPLDPRTASRDELLNELANYFEYCASYHEKLTRRMLAMLSTMFLKHLTMLVQEIVDPEVSEARWKETNKAIPLHETDLQPETEFQCTPDRGDDDDDSSSSSFDVGSTTDIPGVRDADSSDSSLDLADSSANFQGTVIGGDLTAAGHAERQLFLPAPDEKEKWSQEPVDLSQSASKPLPGQRMCPDAM